MSDDDNHDDHHRYTSYQRLSQCDPQQTLATEQDVEGDSLKQKFAGRGASNTTRSLLDEEDLSRRTKGQQDGGKGTIGGSIQAGQSAALPGDGVTTSSSKEPTFPAKLHSILSDPRCEDIIAWLPHGRSWRILQQSTFEQKVLPLFFRHGRYSSFARQVNGWGFRRIKEGDDYNSYYHEYFLRGMPELCKKMKRLKANEMKGHKEQDEEEVPNFYAMSAKNPIPLAEHHQAAGQRPPPRIDALQTTKSQHRDGNTRLDARNALESEGLRRFEGLTNALPNPGVSSSSGLLFSSGGDHQHHFFPSTIIRGNNTNRWSPPLLNIANAVSPTLLTQEANLFNAEEQGFATTRSGIIDLLQHQKNTTRNTTEDPLLTTIMTLQLELHVLEQRRQSVILTLQRLESLSTIMGSRPG